MDFPFDKNLADAELTAALSYRRYLYEEGGDRLADNANQAQLPRWIIKDVSNTHEVYKTRIDPNYHAWEGTPRTGSTIGSAPLTLRSKKVVRTLQASDS